MLTDRHHQLLTAAVDGELSARDVRAVQQLLQESDEARRLYQSLTRDAARLRGLRRKSLPPHFPSQVLQAIGERARVSPSVYEPAARRWLPIWANVAAAAAVMLAVCAGSYLVIVLSDQERADKDVARQNQPKTELTSSAKTTPEPPPAVASSGNAGHREPDLPDAPPPPAVASRGQSKTDTPPTPDEPPSQDLLTGPFSPRVELYKVEPAKLPPILNLRDLSMGSERRKFLDAVKSADAVHIDLFCGDTTRGFERLQSALRAHGQRLVIDVVAQERYNRKLKTFYAVYTDSLTADEIGRLFQQLGADDRRAELLRKDGQFDKLVVRPLTGDSQKTLGQLLGVEPKWLQGRPKSAAPADPAKSLTDATAEKLANRNAPTALVVSYNPMRPSAAASREVRQFLEHRKDPRPEAVPMLLVLRTVD